ncbi:protein CHROMOSOME TRANSMISSION FIDELITY 7-like [Camellia sinensis]|uniref:protein CHROMOSOME TRANSMISSION FIDELITY 7-like n=1 Tax=Camellia sinensis TaxID=4442 RepID=UPI00103630EC|nr:protein CHROMOSOME TRANSMISSION FIDELITY 7-like [Camellia sinensis]
MQAKISAFFNPQPPPKSSNLSQLLHQTQNRSSTAQQLLCLNGAAIQHIEEAPKECNSMSSPNATSISAKNQNKKRSYVQLHLDLGQSDFLLCTCSICGFKFARGDEGDEKVHKEFHKDCSHGIQFKGWHNERVVHLPSTKSGRIILVLDGDPPAHKKKVQKVVQMMEMDLGSGWLIHKLCKVYLYIFHQRIAGCLVAESIKTAYRVLSNSGPPKSVNNTNTNNNGSNSSILQFGGINFQREAVERAPSAINPEASEEDLMGAIFLGNEAVPAICGIRAIWVAPSMRRKQIACQLLDAVRMSFCKGLLLKPSQLAFSNPTSTGRALACRYFGTSSFLAYKAAD